MIYEFLYILSAQYTEAELTATQQKVVGLLEGAGVKIVQQDPSIKLKMGYPIQQNRFGHYSIVYFECETDALPKIQNQLRLSTDIARFQITKVRALPKMPVSLMSFEDVKIRAREAREEYSSGGSGRPTHNAPVTAAPVHTEALAASPAMSMEDLDKKLDQILNEEVS